MFFDTEQNEEILKCGRCKLYFTSKIYLCSLGHSLCSECKNKTERCNVCHNYIQFRNIAAEEILQAVYLENPKLKEVHNSYNQTTSYNPPIPGNIKKNPIWKCIDCNKEYHPYIKLIEHLRSIHKIEFSISQNRIRHSNPKHNDSLAFRIENLRIFIKFKLIEDHKFQMILINYSEYDWISIDGFWAESPVKQMLAPSKFGIYVKNNYIEHLKLSVAIND